MSEPLEEEDEHPSKQRGLDKSIEEDLQPRQAGPELNELLTSLRRQRFFQCRSSTTGKATSILVVPSPRLTIAAC